MSTGDDSGVSEPKENQFPAGTWNKTAGILIFPEVEALDFCGPYEVLSVARLDEAKRRETQSPIRVLLVGKTLRPVTAMGGMVVQPQVDFLTCPPLDVLIIPGGWGTRSLLTSAPLLTWIRQRAAECEILCSVCTGSLLLAAAGLLEGRRATTHWKALDEMHRLFPSVHVIRGQRVVEEDALLTSAGISAGIDMALRILVRISGETVARNTALHMEYPYPESELSRTRNER